VLFDFVLLGLISAVLCREIGRAPPKWPLLCRVGCKTLGC